MSGRNLIIVEYPDGSSMVYEISKEAEDIEEVTSEVFEMWNLKVRNKDGTVSWVRINRWNGPLKLSKSNRGNQHSDELAENVL
ncbi:hypothetical protein J7L18_07390 [Candidatus Bathyarchaeota archaeon]|nr:hypothetical protein [Candidatus Bathyarchaeota archaeon]